MKKVLFLFLILISCNIGAINDIDGNSYELTKIGKQEWFTKNLNVSKFRNGDAILEAKNKEDWRMYGEKGIPAFCNYNFDKANESKYGKLYNWYAVTDVRGLAPEGYHIPDDNDWKELTLFVGDKLECQNKTRSKTGWKKNGTDILGFKGLPAGGIDDRGQFFNIGISGYWWSSTGNDAKYDTWYRPIERFDEIYGAYESHAFGYSIRCLQDKIGTKQNANIAKKPDMKTEIMTYSTTECGDMCGHYFIDSKGVEKQILLPDNCEYEFIENNDNQYKGKKFKITSKSINNSSEEIILKIEMIDNNSENSIEKSTITNGTSNIDDSGSAYDEQTIFNEGYNDYLNCLNKGIKMSITEERAVFDVKFPSGTNEDFQKYKYGCQRAFWVWNSNR